MEATLGSRSTTRSPRTSSIALKAVMAVTGAIWVGFLIGHLGTNLRIYQGAETFNAYYAGLKANPILFWGVRFMLTTSVFAHIAAAIVLMRRNDAARPVAYKKKTSLVSTLGARTMKWTGPLLGLFILYHLLHLTTGQAMPAGVEFVDGDDYANVVGSFSVGYVAIVYIVALVLVGLHLWHGIASAAISLGARHPKYDHLLRRGAALIALVIAGAMLSIPISILAGYRY